MNRKKFYRQAVIALLLCTAAGSLLAQPGWMREQGQERPRKRQQAKEMRREEVRAAHRGQEAPRHRRGMGRQGEAAAHGNGAANGAAHGPSGRHNGRMSPEERQALRRQISEVNQALPHGRRP